PHENRPADVAAVGWFHPDGPSYPASLFALDGKRYLAGVVQMPGRFDWVTYDLQTKQSTAEQLPLKEVEIDPTKTLLYGSLARDDQGACYIVGLTNNRPLALKV